MESKNECTHICVYPPNPRIQESIFCSWHYWQGFWSIFWALFFLVSKSYKLFKESHFRKNVTITFNCQTFQNISRKWSKQHVVYYRLFLKWQTPGINLWRRGPLTYSFIKLYKWSCMQFFMRITGLTLNLIFWLVWALVKRHCNMSCKMAASIVYQGFSLSPEMQAFYFLSMPSITCQLEG